jgi:amidase
VTSPATFNRGKISPVELTTRMLDRIAAIDGKLKSYATVMREQGVASGEACGRRSPTRKVPRCAARRAHRSEDLCYTKGVRTMAGTSIYAGFLPDHGATVVTKLS